MDNSYIYLCIKHNKNYYECSKYDSYQIADKVFNEKYKYEQNISSTMIPVCRFIPIYFHNYILHYKLSKIFIKNKII
jgi:hypothetical protein